MARVVRPGVRRTPRERLLVEVANTIAMVAAGRRVTFVGVDGVDGAGKTTFADELAARMDGLSVIRASVDSFHRPREQRYARGRDSPEGFYLDSYDYPALEAMLLDPLRHGGDFRRAAFDVATDAPVEAPPESASPGSILLFDGIFLQRPELRRQWDVVIYLHVPWEKNHHLAGHPDWNVARYREGQQLYLRACRPRRNADIVVDNTDLRRPVILRRSRAAASPRAEPSERQAGSGSRGPGPGSRRSARPG